MSHTTLAHDGYSHHVIHASCEVFALISLRLSTLHSSPSLSSSFHSPDLHLHLPSGWFGRRTLCNAANEELGTLGHNILLTDLRVPEILNDDLQQVISQAKTVNE